MVEDEVRMCPADLTESLDLPEPQFVTKEAVASACQSVADAIAMRVAVYAGRTGQPLKAALRECSEAVDSAIEHGRSYVFDELVVGMRTWTASLDPGSVRHEFAMKQMRVILGQRDEFPLTARARISRVLTAAAEPAPPAQSATGTGNTRTEPAPAAAPAAAEAYYAFTALVPLRKAVGRCAAWAWVHGIICALGTLFTVATIGAASSAGGRYVVFWGAIVFGAIGCIHSAIRYAKGKEAIAELERRIGAAS
ncbi:hypothetical protein [Sinomonas soli]